MEDVKLRERMRRFYGTSDIYKGFLDAHDESYLRAYITLVTRYSRSKKRILELGCGNGLSAHLLNKQGYWVVGTDISPFFLSDTAQWHDEGLKYIACDALELPFGDESFDVVCSNELIEHVPDARQTLSEMVRVVKKGGLVIIAGPNLLSPIMPLFDLFMMSRGKQGRPVLWETKRQAIRSFLVNFAISLKKRFASLPNFLYRQPDLEDRVIGGDADSVYYANPLDLERFFKNEGLKIIKLCVGFGMKGKIVATLFPRFSPYISMVVEKSAKTE